MKNKKCSYVLLALILLNGCDSSGGGEDLFIPEIENPIVVTEFFGQEGNLYKPTSDDHGAGQGNLVFLASAKFARQFESCSIKKSDGSTAALLCINDQPWTQIPFSCFSNGNRQTWRASFGCAEAGEVKVTCKDLNQEVVFTVPEEQRGFVCNRFG